MSLSHHDRLENTLIAYFQQMLSDEDADPLAGESGVEELPQTEPHLSSAQDAILSELKVLQEQASRQDQEYLKPQRQPQEESAAEPRHFTEPPSLATLLEAVPQTEVETQTATEVKEEVEEKTEVAQETEVKVAEETKVEEKTETAVEEKTETKVEEKAEVATKTEAAEQTVQETVKTAVVETQEAVPAAPLEGGWHSLDLGDEFQTLFFVAGGVRYAVPLISLGSIFECPKLTRIFSQASWHLGITDIRGQKVSVVDTMQFVNPQAGAREEPYPYIITLGQSRWALTCDVLEGNRTISKDAVKWRQTGGGRPWLAGIVKSERCALIYVDEMIKLLDAGFKESSFNQIAQEDI